MRVNVYAEEMTERIEIISKEVEGQTFTGLRLYLELPCTIPVANQANPTRLNTEGMADEHFNLNHIQAHGPFIHRPGDDDSAAVTFWGKQDLRIVLKLMLDALDKHYAAKAIQYGGELK